LAPDRGAAAGAALDRLAGHAALAVHFDLDVVDFLDTPLAENVERQGGVTLDGALAALRVLLADARVVALTVTEVNPDHADPDGVDARRLAAGIARAAAAAQAATRGRAPRAPAARTGAAGASGSSPRARS